MTPRYRLAAVIALAATLVAGCGPTATPTVPLPSATNVAGACPVTPPPDQAAIPEWGATGQHPTVIPQIVSSSGAIACGRTRIVFAFLGRDNVPIGAPDRTASVAFYDLGKDPRKPVASADGAFIWAIENERGVYVVNADLPTAGLYGAEFTTAAPGKPGETIRVQFDVQPRSLAIAIGDKAPASVTPTIADTGGDVTKISTDSQPVKAFYQTSVSDAIKAGKPFLLIFATPKFCVSRQCGPTLDRIKPIAASHPGFTIINVEPYQLKDVDGQLQPVTQGDPPQLVPTTAADEWKLLSEPWIYVVDGHGVVTASFEAVASDQELDAAITAVE